MKALFLVPSIGQDDLLSTPVAGLPLWERLHHHAKKAGMQPIFILSRKSPLIYSLPKESVALDVNGVPCTSGMLTVVCSPGSLPQVECLKEILKTEFSGDDFLDLDGLLAFFPSKGCFELERAFVSHGFENLRDFLSQFLRADKRRCVKGRLFSVNNERDRKRAEKELFKALVKDTEGFMSRHVERPISLFISKRLVKTSITPNQITVISTLIGLIGAFFISIGQGFWQVMGALFFLAHSIVDGCDGEIARIKFMESRIGGILDFWGDNLVHAAVFWAIGAEWSHRTGSVFPLYLSAAAVLGTFLSASIVYFSTMKKAKEGPLYTSVSTSKKKGRIVRIADFLSRRDFIYLVVILAFFNHLDWFLAAASIGSLVFAGVLVWIRLKG